MRSHLLKNAIPKMAFFHMGVAMYINWKIKHKSHVNNSADYLF